MLSWKQNVSGLNSRNIIISLKDFCLEFHNFVYCTQSCKIYILVLIGALLYTYTQHVGEAKVFQLSSSLGIYRTNRLLIIII